MRGGAEQPPLWRHARLRSARLLPVLAGLAAFLLYVLTLAPDLLWSDSAKHLVLVARGEVAGFGFGRHPLHTLAGMAFARLPAPLPWTQNLLSAASAAGAVALLAAAGARLAGPAAGALAALALAVSHTFWHYAVLNESYALFWLLLAGALLAALRTRESGSARSLGLLSLVLGLAFSAHGLAALAAPGLLLLALGGGASRRPGAAAGAVLAGLVLGLAPLWLPALLLPAPAEVRESTGLLASAAEHARLFLRPARLLRGLAVAALLLAYQFPGPALVLLALGARRLAGRPRGELAPLAAAALPVVLFAAAYFPPRQFALTGAAWVLLAPLLACGLGALLARASRATALALAAALLLGPPLVYALAARAASGRMAALGVRALPFRDEARYFLWPPKRDATGARRYVDAARRLLPGGATVIADFNPGEPLRYAVEVERSLDLRLLEVVDDLVHAGGDPGPRLEALLVRELAAGAGPVWLADRWEPYYRIEHLRARFRIEPLGPFVRVSPRAAP